MLPCSVKISRRRTRCGRARRRQISLRRCSAGSEPHLQTIQAARVDGPATSTGFVLNPWLLRAAEAPRRTGFPWEETSRRNPYGAPGYTSTQCALPLRDGPLELGHIFPPGPCPRSQRRLPGAGGLQGGINWKQYRCALSCPAGAPQILPARLPQVPRECRTDTGRGRHSSNRTKRTPHPSGLDSREHLFQVSHAAC